MPTLQRTFELIPTTLVKSYDAQPTRMTSKAVKKAYQQANRQPRVSRAEQRQRDAEELERQKKEYERERAAARAKAAREKKAAKENAEKEARRKMGLPEPSRFVRSSQPTISTFVRNGTRGKRSWQEMKMDSVIEDSDATLSDTGLGGKDDEQPPAKRVVADDDSENEFGEFPSLSQSDILEKIDSSMMSTKEEGAGPGYLAVAGQPPEHLCREPSQELPERKSPEDECPLEDSQAFSEMANTQLLSEAAEAAQRLDSAELTMLPVPRPTLRKPTSLRRPTQPGSKAIIYNKGHTKSQKSPVSRPALQEVSINMPPPPVPFKDKKTISFTPTPQKPKITPRNTTKSNNKPPCNIPPSATQAFLENHLDDFFPSPTQELRELLSDGDSLPSKTQLAREFSLERPKEAIHNLPPNRYLTAGVSLTRPVTDDHFDDLICTQDLILSSQELLEIVTTSRAAAKPDFEAELAKQKPASKAKPRFFEEKEDDILHAALQESKKTSTRPQPQSPHIPNKRHTFFEEKEDDLLAAAIHESKMMAAKEAKVLLKETCWNERKERTLKRVISTATTDYGEDEFSGGEWESLGL